MTAYLSLVWIRDYFYLDWAALLVDMRARLNVVTLVRAEDLIIW